MDSLMDLVRQMTTFVKSSFELDTLLRKHARDLNESNSDLNNTLPIVMCSMIGIVNNALINPASDENDDQLKSLSLFNNEELLNDKVKRTEAKDLITNAFAKKHKIVFDLVNELNDSATLTDEQYNSIVLEKDIVVNEIIDKYINEVQPLFDKDNEEDSLNSAIGLSIFSIHAIRRCLYSYGISTNPKFKTMVDILSLQ